MNKLTVEFTRAELVNLRNHLKIDLSFNSGGTFGDGNDIYKKEYNQAQKTLLKIEQVLYS